MLQHSWMAANRDFQIQGAVVQKATTV